MKPPLTVIHTYVDELIPNEDGMYDSLGSAWFIVPTEWAERMIRENYDISIDEFFKEYTYDWTDDWLRQAIKAGVLVGAGVGIVDSTALLAGMRT